MSVSSPPASSGWATCRRIGRSAGFDTYSRVPTSVIELDLPLLSVVRERGDLILRDITNMDENHNFIPDDLRWNYKVVGAGQFALNKMKACLQGSYGVSRSCHGIVSPAYYVFDIHGRHS